MIPLAGTTTEASKTEPDKNTYLVLKDQHGFDPTYDYGRHFLYQGHELGAGHITRINLDADPAHRVTLLATQDTDGKALPGVRRIGLGSVHEAAALLGRARQRGRRLAGDARLSRRPSST